MKKISTRNLEFLPNGNDLKNLCKSISAIEAIICSDWEFRYFTYNRYWGHNQEVCELNNGQGDQINIFFNQHGIVINGFAHESPLNSWNSNTEKNGGTSFKNFYKPKRNQTLKNQNIGKKIIAGLPTYFEEFIYGEPVKNIGTTFCLWQGVDNKNWHTGDIEFLSDDDLDGSAELLYFLDHNPGTYKVWAEEYYLDQFEHFELNIKAIEAIYNQVMITKEIVESINPGRKDFENLKSDLNEIGYNHDLL